MDRKQQVGILPIEAAAAARFTEPIPEEDLKKSWQFILPDGRRFMTGAAGAQLFLHIDSMRWLGKIIQNMRLIWLVGLLYRTVSRLRPFLGHLVFDKPGPHRSP